MPETNRIQGMESEILAFWERERIFERSVERDPSAGEFVFFDGPPTANAPPGMHHVEPQTYKDVIPRYKTMRGYRVARKAGWDTHGLPVELQIEKTLGLRTKKDIEAYGVAKFNAACRDSVWEFKGDWEKLKRRMGSWMDMANPYVTYEMSYVESVWWFLKAAWEKGLLVRDYRSVWYCPRCETTLSSHEVALGYKDDVEDPSIYVKFQIPSTKFQTNSKFQIPNLKPDDHAYFLAWTTTPWTLPGNVALAVHPEVEYAVVRIDDEDKDEDESKKTERAPESPSVGSETRGAEGGLSPSHQDSILRDAVKSDSPQPPKSPTAGPGGDRTPKGRVTGLPSAPAAGPVTAGHHPSYLIIAKPLVERVLGPGAEIVRTILGKDLVGTRYEPLYPPPISPPPLGGGARGGGGDVEQPVVLPADFVSLEDGTGIVHIAPAYGQEDFELGKQHGIPPLFTVQPNGVVMDGYPGAGKFFKAADADVRADLTHRGLLFRDETVRHTYPFCWRCDTPLLAYARASWYIAMSKLRSEIQARNRTINWLPDHIREGRFGEWLRELKDWAITRERYWGAPIPVWHCTGREQQGSPPPLSPPPVGRGRKRGGGAAAQQGSGGGYGHIEVLGSFADLIARAPKRNRFILMRHGEAESNVRDVISSKVETSDRYPLTENGVARVRQAAADLRSAGITKVIASPFHRMRQTAAIVSEAIGLPATYADELREYDLPDFDGTPTASYNALFRTRREKFERKIGENETWNELRERLLRYLKRLDDAHEDETFLILTHGDNLWLLRWALSGKTYDGIDSIPYPGFDAPTPLLFTGHLVNDRGELDVHRPFIDTITWPCAKEGCNGMMRRFPEVVDVWLESGCMPFAQLHFPFENAAERSSQPSALSPQPAGAPTAQVPNFPPSRGERSSPSSRGGARGGGTRSVQGEREGVGSPLAHSHTRTLAPPSLYPADYISEAIDQTRGWFYTLLAVATVLGWDAPYRNVVVLGHLLDKHGQKMSKSKGNVVDPIAMIDRYGADVVRWYMVSVNQAWDPKRFDEADLKTMSNKPFGTLRNVLEFWKLHGGGAAPTWPTARGKTSGAARGKTPDFEEPARGGREKSGVEERATDGGIILDHWLRARTRQTYDAVTQHLDAYALTDAARAIGELIDDLSTWWLRRSRERLRARGKTPDFEEPARGGREKSGVDERAEQAQRTFTAALHSLAILLAPFAPFTAEHLFRSLPLSSERGGGAGGGGESAHSVHLAAWDEFAPPTGDGDEWLLSQMAAVRRICSLGLEARAAAGIPVRQPLAKLLVRASNFSLSRREGEREGEGSALLALIADELNVKDIVVDPALTEEVHLDTTLTPELKREGMVRELTRAVNAIRKDMGLTPKDRICVAYQTDSAELAAAIAEHRADIERMTVSNFSPSARGKTSGVAGGRTPEVEEARSAGKTSGVEEPAIPGPEERAHHTLTISGSPITLDIAREV